MLFTDAALADMAVESRSWWLLRRQFTLWQKRLERARELANFQRLVEEMGKRAVKRRALSQWRHCITTTQCLSTVSPVVICRTFP